MVELMTVIGIMIILAGILIASLPGIQARVNRNKVETFIAELESGLSKYQIEHGNYPQNPPSGDRDSSGQDGASVLYKHLSGDWNEDGATDRDDVVELVAHFGVGAGDNDPQAASGLTTATVSGHAA